MENWKNTFMEEIREIGEKHSLKAYHAFIFWYLKATEDLPNETILNILTDGSNDGGIDAIYIDHTVKKIKVYQSKFTAHIGQSAFNKDELVKLREVYRYLEGLTDYDSIRSYVNAKLKHPLDSAIELMRQDGYKVELIFITNINTNENSSIYNGTPPYIQIISAKELELKFREWQHGHTPELGEIELSYTAILHGPKNPNGYLVTLEANSLRKIYIKFKEKLFSRNVRIFYGETKKKGSPNINMKETLLNSSENFWYFNNGVTILAQQVIVDHEKKELKLHNPQIINGCQTVSIIGNNKESAALLFAKIIEINDNVANQSMIDGIIESNNRQNPVDERILKSNHPLQVNLARKLVEEGFYYERKENQWSEESKKHHEIKVLKKINNLELARTNVAIELEPHRAFDDENELFSIHFSEIFKELQQKSHLKHLFPYLIWKRIREIGDEFRINAKDRESFNKLASWHILRLVYDYCDEVKINSSERAIADKLKSKKWEFSPKLFHELFDILYELYKKSELYLVNSGQRDFFKRKDTYDLFKGKVKKSSCNELKSLFNDKY